MGGAHEHAKTLGRGNRPERTDLRITHANLQTADGIDSPAVFTLQGTVMRHISFLVTKAVNPVNHVLEIF